MLISRKQVLVLVLCVLLAAALLGACQNALPQSAQAAAGPVEPPASTATPMLSAAMETPPQPLFTPEASLSDALPASAPIITPTPQKTEAPVSSPTLEEEQPPLLSSMLKKYGLSIEDVAGEQLLLLAYAPGESKLCLYDKNNAGMWKLMDSFPANVGKNGVTDDKAEGDKATPIGFYRIGLAFGIQSQPDTVWTYRQVTPDSYWVDDPDSVYYNTWVEGTENKDWDSAEHLIDATAAYAYAMVIEYNTDPIVPGKGSAIFLHVGDHPTAGCISVAQSHVLAILKWLKPEANPHILIADTE